MYLETSPARLFFFAYPDIVQVVVDNATARALVLGTLDHIVASQQPSGNFPAEYYDDDEDVLVCKRP